MNIDAEFEAIRRAESNSCLWLATRADMTPGLRRIEARNAYVYIRAGLYFDRDIPVLTSAFDIHDLGVFRTESESRAVTYLVLPRTVPVHVDSFRSGDRESFSVTNAGNPSGFLVTFGGVCLAGKVVGGGCLQSATASAGVDELAVDFAREFTRIFETVTDSRGVKWRAGVQAYFIQGAGFPIDTEHLYGANVLPNDIR